MYSTRPLLCAGLTYYRAFYSAQTMVDNLGFTLTPDSMISFRDAEWPMFIMSFLAFAGNTLYPVFHLDHFQDCAPKVVHPRTPIFLAEPSPTVLHASLPESSDLDPLRHYLHPQLHRHAPHHRAGHTQPGGCVPAMGPAHPSGNISGCFIASHGNFDFQPC